MNISKIKRIVIQYEDGTFTELSFKEIFNLGKVLTLSECNYLMKLSDKEKYDLQQKLRDAPLSYEDWLKYAIMDQDLFEE